MNRRTFLKTTVGAVTALSAASYLSAQGAVEANRCLGRECRKGFEVPDNV